MHSARNIFRKKIYSKILTKVLQLRYLLSSIGIGIAVIGTFSALVLISNSQDLRQRAALDPYIDCPSDSSKITSGVDAGACRCVLLENIIVNPGQTCPTPTPRTSPDGCTPNTTKCEFSVAQQRIMEFRCLADAQFDGYSWMPFEVCERGCSGNRCAPDPTATITPSGCQPGSTQCREGVLYTCTSGSGSYQSSICPSGQCDSAERCLPIPTNTPKPLTPTKTPTVSPTQTKKPTASPIPTATNKPTLFLTVPPIFTKTPTRTATITPTPTELLIAKNCLYNTCVNSRWCGNDGVLTDLICNSNRCDYYTATHCLNVTATPAVKVITNVPTKTPRPTGTPSPRPTSLPPGSCIPDTMQVGQGSICCSGRYYQNGTAFICGAQPGATCNGFCLNTTSCTNSGRVSGGGRCTETGQQCCGPRLNEVTPTPVLAANCRQDSDCGFGFVCLEERNGDGSRTCQPEVRTRRCFTYNFETQQCEYPLAYAGLSCPIGSSPNSDVCVHPPTDPGIAQISCIPGQSAGEARFCVGNNSVGCTVNGETQIFSCPGGCVASTGYCVPITLACLPGTQWCAAGQLATCTGSGIAQSDIQMQTCPYGCDYLLNTCLPNPNNLTYVEALEQQIEQQYGVSISLDSNVTGVEGVVSDQSAYNTLVEIQAALAAVPTVFLDQISVIEIYPEDNTDVEAYTLQNGFLAIEACDQNQVDTGDCQHTVLHEIGHNTEEFIVTSSSCPENNTVSNQSSQCTAMEGFIVAAEEDPNPLIFDHDGNLDHEQSDMAEMNSHSAQTVSEFYANYQAIYFLEDEKMYCGHPNIFQYFQDIYHQYDGNWISQYDCSGY